MAVLLIGTLDTKGAEVAFVRDRLRAAGVAVTVLDAGVLGEPAFPADIPREEVFAAAGADAAAVKAAGDRGAAVKAAGDRGAAVKAAGDRGAAVSLAAAGAAAVAVRLHRDGWLTGVLGLGGSAGTTIATAAMRELPIGVPKLVVSTLASGDVRPFVGTRDVMMLHSVVDIAGLNRISRAVLDNAAAAMAGMILHPKPPAVAAEKPIVTATMFGVTTPCVEAARAVIEKAGYEVLVFHATGSGGRTMEGLIRDGLVAGVLDITTTELADELAGGVLSAGPDRLTAAGAAGVPQVISVGALDMVNFGPPDTVPPKYADRRFYRHNANVTLMRTTPDENAALGAEVALKASRATGPTAVLLPLRGVSAIDADGKPFWWPEADAALFAAVRAGVGGAAVLEEHDRHVNDPTFAAACAAKLLALMAEK